MASALTPAALVQTLGHRFRHLVANIERRRQGGIDTLAALGLGSGQRGDHGGFGLHSGIPRPAGRLKAFLQERIGRQAVAAGHPVRVARQDDIGGC